MKVLSGLIFFIWILQGCSDKEKGNDENLHEIGKHNVDLFLQDRMIYDNTDKLSIDEAFHLSKEVLHVASLEKIDSSQSRGVTPFYIYKVKEGRFEKSSGEKQNKFPVLFLSEEKFFKGRVLNDSVYLFLEPLQKYELLQKSMVISYKWVNNAPFLDTRK